MDFLTRLDSLCDNARNTMKIYSKEVEYLSQALELSKQFSEILLGDKNDWTADDENISQLVHNAVNDLEQSIEAFLLGRLKVANVVLRCFLEQMFFAMYYREQAIEFNLWQKRSDSFVMLHQLCETNHPFRLYFKSIFEDYKDTKQPNNQKKYSKQIFEHLEKLYDLLSDAVHSKLSKPDHGGREEEIADIEVRNYISRVLNSISIIMEFLEVCGYGELPNEISQEFKYDIGMVIK